jgi:biopolymer transport protein ExbD
MAASSFMRRGRSRIVAEINVTPLTDVFLVLLVIFMITTSAMMESAADVELPSAAETTTESKGVVVTVTSGQEIFVGDRRVTGGNAELVTALRDALRLATDKVVILAGDRNIVLGEVVRVLSLSKEAGATGFALAADG